MTSKNVPAGHDLDRLGSTVALVLVAVLVATLAYRFTRSADMTPAGVTDICRAEVLFLGVRGSDGGPDENDGFGATVLAAQHAMKDAFRPRTVAAEAIGYEAAGLPAAIGGAGGSYASSRLAGVTALRTTLERWSAACPGGSLVMAGYSQGADVVGDVVADLAASASGPDDGILGSILGVALLGDPRYNPDDPVAAGRPAPGRRGVLGARPLFPAALRDRIGSWCLPGDVICNAGPAVDCFATPGACAHFQYRERGVAAEAGAWLAAQARAGAPRSIYRP